MAGIEGKHNARKPSRASALQEIYSRPLKEGTGLQPRFINGEYRGERLHPDVQRRLEEYAAIPSLTTQDIARMMR